MIASNQNRSALQRVPQGKNGSALTMRNVQRHAALPFCCDAIGLFALHLQRKPVIQKRRADL